MSSVKASPRVPLRSPAALLAMTTAEAPAAYAFCALSAKVQPPRLTRAIRPAGKPAKSAASQPGVASDARPGHRADRGGDVAAAGVAEDRVGHRAGRSRRDPLEHGGAERDEGVEHERLHLRGVAGGRQPLHDVVDRRVVAGGAGDAGAVVGVGDPLQRGLVLAHAGDGDALGQLGVGVVDPAAAGGGPATAPGAATHTEAAAPRVRRALVGFATSGSPGVRGGSRVGVARPQRRVARRTSPA